MFETIGTETDPFVISHFILEIGLLGDDNDRKKLIGYIDHDDARVRANAIESAGLISDKEYIIKLLESRLSDSNNRNRSNAAIRLYQLGELSGLDTLIKMCVDRENYLMRASGAYGIGEITSKEQARVIAEKLEDKNAALAPLRLEKLECARIMLEKLLTDDEMIVKTNAARALGRMGNPLSITVLVENLKKYKRSEAFYCNLLAALKELTSPNVFAMIEKKFVDGID